jgi:hypothetical protein
VKVSTTEFIGPGQASAAPDGNYLHREGRLCVFFPIPTN